MRRAYIYAGETITLHFRATAQGEPFPLEGYDIEIIVCTTAMGRQITRTSRDGIDLSRAAQGIVSCEISAAESATLTPGRGIVHMRIERDGVVTMGSASPVEILRPLAVPTPCNSREVPVDVILDYAVLDVSVEMAGRPGHDAVIEQVRAEAVPYTEPVQVLNEGTPGAARLLFRIPRGEPGEDRQALGIPSPEAQDEEANFRRAQVYRQIVGEGFRGLLVINTGDGAVPVYYSYVGHAIFCVYSIMEAYAIFGFDETGAIVSGVETGFMARHISMTLPSQVIEEEPDPDRALVFNALNVIPSGVLTLDIGGRLATALYSLGEAAYARLFYVDPIEGVEVSIDLRSDGSLANRTVYSRGGYTYIERYDRRSFQNALSMAIRLAADDAILDCTFFTGQHRLSSGFRIDKPLKIVFGSIDVTFDNPADENLFTLLSDNIILEGRNRHTDKTVVSSPGATVFRMINPSPGLEGYHVKSRGNKNIVISSMTLVGVQSTLGRQYGNEAHPIDGVGGIYLEKGNPGTTSAGNTVNAVRLTNLLIDKTKAHAIYLDTPILAQLRDIRISDAAGHGVFVNGGTTMLMESVYVASCQMAGFCIFGQTYSTLLNCVAENCGCGFWIRSSFNVTLFNPGVEQTKTYGANPWRNSQPVSGKYGFGLTTTAADGTTVDISDVTASAAGYFIGHGFLLSGGRNITLHGPYAMNLAGVIIYEAYPTGTQKSRNVRYLLVEGNNRSSTVHGLGVKDTVGTAAVQRFEVELSKETRSFELVYDVTETTLTYQAPTPVVTADEGLSAPVLNLSSNAYIRSGGTVLSPLTEP